MWQGDALRGSSEIRLKSKAKPHAETRHQSRPSRMQAARTNKDFPWDKFGAVQNPFSQPCDCGLPIGFGSSVNAMTFRRSCRWNDSEKKRSGHVRRLSHKVSGPVERQFFYLSIRRSPPCFVARTECRQFIPSLRSSVRHRWPPTPFTWYKTGNAMGSEHKA